MDKDIDKDSRHRNKGRRVGQNVNDAGAQCGIGQIPGAKIYGLPKF